MLLLGGKAMTQPLQNTLDNLISLIAREIANKCVQELERWREQSNRAARVDAATRNEHMSVDTRNHWLKLKEVQLRVALSRSSIYLMVNRGEFPKPVKIGRRAVAWSEASITRWMAQKASADADDIRRDFLL
jgi:prophage regulatory protein